MDRTNLYEDDILAWSEQQAAALRRLASHRDLPNDLDLENVVEEIESVGLSQLRAAESLIRLILLHVAKAASDPVAKAASDPGAPSVAHWDTECIGWQDELLRAFSPSMRQRIGIDAIWRSAQRQAAAALREYGAKLSDDLTGPCPVSLDELLSDGFDFRATVERLARAAP